MGSGQVEQHCTLCVHMSSFLYSTVQLPGFSLASVEVALTLKKKNRSLDAAYTIIHVKKALPFKKGPPELIS